MRPRPKRRRPLAPRRSRRGRSTRCGVEEKEWHVATQTMEAPAKENFAALLDESLGMANGLEGTVVKGRVIAIENDAVLIDVGLKSEGRVAAQGIRRRRRRARHPCRRHRRGLSRTHGGQERRGPLSREKARREEAWTLLEKNFQANERVTGVIFGRVKGGFTVDLNGAVAFLPGSQVDIRPVRDITPLLGSPQPFQILKMDRSRGNIVVSRRAVLEESRAEQRSELVASLKEGQILNGVVKNITDYGAFVDLGGVDGLLHVTDIAWRRINHPSEALNIGQNVKVQVIRFNPETQRISLGMKQLEADPWEGVDSKYPAGAKFTRPRHQHHRLRRLCRTGAGGRGPGPRLRNELDQEERASRQDRLDQPGGRGHGARCRSAKAAHQPRPQADPGQSVGQLSPRSTRSAARSRARSATSPSSACSSACRATSTAWSICPTSTGTEPGEDALDDYHKGELVTRQGARRRCREGAHQPRHQAARSRPVRSRHDQAAARARSSPARSPGSPRAGSRSRSATACSALSASRSCRATAASSAPTASPSAKRSTPRSRPSTAPPAR